MQYSVLEQTTLQRGDHMLGADETKPAGAFVRLVNPTELDKTAKEMSRLIKDYHAGWDFANPSLWRKLGLSVDSGSGPLHDFLQRYIQYARETRTHLSERNKDVWIQQMHERYGTRLDDLQDYIRAMLDMIRAGTMPDVILKPYSYEPTEIGADMLEAVFPKLVIATAIIGGVMILSSTIIPQITQSVGAARARRRK